MLMKTIVFAAAATWAFVGLPAHATVLTFDITPSPGNFNGIPVTYGDNVTSATMPNPPTGTFSYGTTGGFTPNVTVDYGETFADTQSFWSTGYGNLTNIAFEDVDSVGVFNLSFAADPGYLVSLLSFDLAAYTGDFASDPTINSVIVYDSLNVPVFTALGVSVSRATRTSLQFTPALTDTSLRVEIDARNLGVLNDSVGMDNFAFSQAVTATCIPGDFNCDDVVDAADYVVWRKNPNGTYTSDDFNIWRANFGEVVASGFGAGASNAVPEPATLVMLMFVTAGWCLRRGWDE